MPEIPVKIAGKIRDLSDQKFGRLTAMRPIRKVEGGRVHWVCSCECGGEAIVHGVALTLGHSKSCGCIKNKHGRSTDPIYKGWWSMMQRCNYPKHISYKNYGGKGVRVCARWRNFKNFLADMGERPSSRHSIDRIDSSKGYSPDNCRWATWAEQSRNKSVTRLLTLNGETLCVADWAKKTGIPRSTLNNRMRKGMTLHEAIAKPIHKQYRPSQ